MGRGGRQVSLRLRTAPTCQSWGAIRPPAAWTSSTTRFQPASARLAVEARDVGVVSEAGPVDPRPLGEDQAHLVLGAAAVVGGDLGRPTPPGEKARHRRHDDAVGERKRTDTKWSEKNVGTACGHVSMLR